MVRLAHSRDKHVIVFFYFWSRDEDRGVMFRESYLRRVFVHAQRSQNRLLKLF